MSGGGVGCARPAAIDDASERKLAASIGYVIDADGFAFPGGEFVAKELAVYETRNDLAWSKYYLPARPWSELTPKEREQARYVTRRVHGMPYEDRRKGDRPQKELSHDLRELCERATREGKLIAYKGGIYEKRLLRSLGYERVGVDLERLRCPTYRELVGRSEEFARSLSTYACDRHRAYGGDETVNATTNRPGGPENGRTAVGQQRRGWERSPLAADDYGGENIETIAAVGTGMTDPAVEATDSLLAPHERREELFAIEYEEPLRPVHCPRAEVRCFALWLRKRLEQRPLPDASSDGWRCDVS